MRHRHGLRKLNRTSSHRLAMFRNLANALIQHECDHLDGILYPMRMKDLTKFGFNDTPGDIESDMKLNKDSIDPLFLELVSKWPLKNN